MKYFLWFVLKSPNFPSNRIISSKSMLIATKSVQIWFGKFRERFWLTKISEKQNVEQIALFSFEELLILRACRYFPTVIYGSKSLHSYPGTSPEAVENSCDPFLDGYSRLWSLRISKIQPKIFQKNRTLNNFFKISKLSSYVLLDNFLLSSMVLKELNNILGQVQKQWKPWAIPILDTNG